MIIEEWINKLEEVLAIIQQNRASDLKCLAKKKVKQLIRDAHLNQEKKKMFMHICEEYSDMFHLERELLTCTAVISHEITTRTDFAAENVQLYRLPDKYKPEVNK